MAVKIFANPKPEWKPFSMVRRSNRNKHLVDFDPIFPLIVECYNLFIDHHLTPHSHDYLEIAYVVEGRGFCELRGQRAPVQPGDLVLVGDTDFHTFWSDYRNSLRIEVIYFLPELISRGGYDFLNYDYIAQFRADGHPAVIPKSQVASDFPKRVERLYWMRHGKPTPLLAVKTELYEILLSVATMTAGSGGPHSVAHGRSRQFTDQPLSAGGSTHAGKRRIDRVIAYLHSNIETLITLSECAAIAGLSRYAFCRYFRRVTGYSLIEYVHKMRIDQARDLLAATQRPVSHIALDVGYQTISYFNRVFRSLVGMTPTEFRKRVRVVVRPA